MTSTFGRNIRITVFGEAQGECIGITCDGLPAGMPVDMQAMEAAIAKRKAYGDGSTETAPEDIPHIISGMTGGATNGAPLTIIFENKKPSGESPLIFRPSHADYTAYTKLGGYNDHRAGGHFSGRLTAVIAALGSVLREALKATGVHIGTHVSQCGDVRDDDMPETDVLDIMEKLTAVENKAFAVFDDEKGEEMRELIDAAAEEGDTVGGVLETAVIGLPVGVGSPFFDSLEGVLAHMMFAVPGVKGVEFGMGFGFGYLNGSEANDQWVNEDGAVRTKSNMSGGINGGISNGMPVIFRTAFRPAPTVHTKQQTVDPVTHEEKELELKAHLDPAIFHRARIIVDSMTAIAVFDLMLDMKRDIWKGAF